MPKSGEGGEFRSSKNEKSADSKGVSELSPESLTKVENALSSYLERSRSIDWEDALNEAVTPLSLLETEAFAIALGKVRATEHAGGHIDPPVVAQETTDAMPGIPESKRTRKSKPSQISNKRLVEIEDAQQPGHHNEEFDEYNRKERARSNTSRTTAPSSLAKSSKGTQKSKTVKGLQEGLAAFVGQQKDEPVPQPTSKAPEKKKSTQSNETDLALESIVSSLKGTKVPEQITPPRAGSHMGRSFSIDDDGNAIIDTVKQGPVTIPHGGSFRFRSDEDLVRQYWNKEKGAFEDKRPDVSSAQGRARNANAEEAQPADSEERSIDREPRSESERRHFMGREYFIDEETGEAIVKTGRGEARVKDGEKFTFKDKKGKSTPRYWLAEEARFADKDHFDKREREFRDVVEKEERDARVPDAEAIMRGERERTHSIYRARESVRARPLDISSDLVSDLAHSIPEFDAALQHVGKDALARSVEEGVRANTATAGWKIAHVHRALEEYKKFQTDEYQETQRHLLAVGRAYGIDPNDFNSMLKVRNPGKRRAAFQQAVRPKKGWFKGLRAFIKASEIDRRTHDLYEMLQVDLENKKRSAARAIWQLAGSFIQGRARGRKEDSHTAQEEQRAA